MTGLSDIRIIAVEQYGAGPFGSLHLAELGADVVKVEDARTDGDIGRHVPPFAEDNDSLFFQSFNRNKRSVCLDLSVPAGTECCIGSSRTPTRSCSTSAGTCRTSSACATPTCGT